MKFKEVKELPVVKRNKPSKYKDLLIEFNKTNIKMVDITEYVPINRQSPTASYLKKMIIELKFKITVTVRNKKIYLSRT